MSDFFWSVLCLFFLLMGSTDAHPGVRLWVSGGEIAFKSLRSCCHDDITGLGFSFDVRVHNHLFLCVCNCSGVCVCVSMGRGVYYYRYICVCVSVCIYIYISFKKKSLSLFARLMTILDQIWTQPFGLWAYGGNNFNDGKTVVSN